jgi:hypothetical protein
MKNFITLLIGIGWSLACLCQNVVQGEYFIDTDLGFGNNTLVNFTPVVDGTFPLSIDLTGMQPGYHKLYIRTKGSDGNWSLTARRNIDVPLIYSKTTITSGEYFIDTDPGFGNGTPVTISSSDSIILQNFNAATASLSEGYHKLYGRLMDNTGKWGLTFRRNIEVFKNVDNKVQKVEYFFKTDLGVGECASATFATPAADGSFTFDIPRNSIPAGADTLFVRVQDDLDSRWSLTQWEDLAMVLPLTLLDFKVAKQNTTALVSWQTANEVNTAYFNVLRSRDGNRFNTVGRVEAKNMSSLQGDYSYTDDLAGLAPGIVYYRLQMLDQDGSYSFSPISHITIGTDGSQMRIFPNPAHGYFVIRNYGIVDVANAAILVKDVSGRILISQKFTNDSEQRVNIASLSKGIYLVSVVANGNVQTKKLLVE